ncbi:hypothetical protein JI57_02930 [Psychromonas sp. PRT-SC03]|nr:hypothetical protein JI57_02930 [Psychromonas sp. PRT-SC03]
MKLNYKIMLPCLLFISLSGCSALKSQPSDEMRRLDQQQSDLYAILLQQIENNDRIKKLEFDISSWNEVEPTIHRLISIEDELNSLIEQLATLTQKTQDDALAQQEKQMKNKNGTSYMLQLASVTSIDKVQSTWKYLQKQNPNRLFDLEVRYQKVEVKGRTYYRLKVGNFSKTDATNNCKALNKRGIACIVSAYTGTPL